ncbi:phage portal protein [Pseudoduganella sp. UC29_106]|uniref:phage portal protein n=1 Tax=Pseudoduganella sp. UC29_106 TaxID=3374553 RepID=UPI0037572808
MSIDLDKIAEGVIAAVKGFVANAVSGLSQRIDGLESAVKAWQPVDTKAIAREAADLIPAPKDGQPGKDADIEAIRGMVVAEVAKIPRPENGKDAEPEAIIRAAQAAIEALPKPVDGKSITAEDVAPMLAQLVADAFKAVPTPADGKDADPEVIRSMVAEALDALPKAKDGTSVTVDDVAPVIAEEVQRAVSALPPAAPGRDADPAEIVKMVEAAVAALPKPENGKDADPALVAKMVAEEVAKIPAPKDGKDADPEQIRTLVAEAVKDIPAPKDGQSVPIEEVQKMVAEAVAKAVAAIVVKDGAPGRDALHLEILPAIDTEKSYVRNTYATHNGGLWRSYETTHGMKGWECVVDGVAGIEVQAPDERTCVVVIRQASGAEERKEFTIPGVVDKGIFRDGEAYKRGDGVTFGGSWFLAQKDQPAGKPGESSDWRLAAKRGRDGKDAMPPAVKEVGPVRLK